MLYGIWHTKGGLGGGSILPNSRVIVMQLCGRCRRAGRRKGRLIRAQPTRSKTISCKGQVVLTWRLRRGGRPDPPRIPGQLGRGRAPHRRMRRGGRVGRPATPRCGNIHTHTFNVQHTPIYISLSIYLSI